MYKYDVYQPIDGDLYMPVNIHYIYVHLIRLNVSESLYNCKLYLITFLQNFFFFAIQTKLHALFEPTHCNIERTKCT